MYKTRPSSSRLTISDPFERTSSLPQPNLQNATMHLASVILLLSLTLTHALPTIKSLPSPPSNDISDLEANLPQTTTYTVKGFQGWLTATPTAQYPNWFAFAVHTSGGSSYGCNVVAQKPLLGSLLPCEEWDGSDSEMMSFTLGAKFGEVEIQRSYRSGE